MEEGEGYAHNYEGTNMIGSSSKHMKAFCFTTDFTGKNCSYEVRLLDFASLSLETRDYINRKEDRRISYGAQNSPIAQKGWCW